MNDFKKLKVWGMSMDLTHQVYSTTTNFPKNELYTLTQQINRAAISIPSNIAEGCGRMTKKDFYRFLTIAMGSSYELETQLILSNKLGYINHQDLDDLIGKLNETQRMLFNLMKSLEDKILN